MFLVVSPLIESVKTSDTSILLSGAFLKYLSIVMKTVTGAVCRCLLFYGFHR